MFRFIKIFSAILMLLSAGGQSSFGFALGGPFEGYQVPAIGYHLPGDTVAPKNFAQGYRWNTPTNYYAIDASFQTYFGARGVAEIDKAMATFTSLSNVSSYSPDLSEWPQSATRINASASALNLVDLKSVTMSLMCEELGLAEPERWTWCLHDRILIGPLCPDDYNYIVIQRNYDPLSQVYSPYVNGNLYGFQVFETCLLNPNPFPFLADTEPITLDPNNTLSAVASFGSTIVGNYYTGLTRDDIGGLRYLYSSTNAYVEAAETNSLLVTTNFQNAQVLVTSNLAVLSAQALTNNQAALQLLYPNLIIVPASNIIAQVVTTNVFFFFTNAPLAPAGTLLLKQGTNYVTNLTQLFSYTFPNVFTNHYYTNGFLTVQTVSVTNKPNAPAGTIFTNITQSTTLIPMINGDFFILPTNACGSYIPVLTNFPPLVQVIPVTNLVITATNTAPVVTNIFTFSEQIISYFTNYQYAYFPQECSSNTVDLREGMEHITFVRVDYDSGVGSSWNSGKPITNIYQLIAITNGVRTVHTFQRIVTRPDILFQVSDLTTGPAAVPIVFETFRTTPNFNVSQVKTNVAGPGTIAPGVLIQYNDTGPAYYNSLAGGFFISPAPEVFFPDSAFQLQFQWGTFDGTTNVPVVYPNHQDIASIESQIFFQILSTNLPAASITTNNVGNPYTVALSLVGPGGGSVTWATSNLPGGLSLNATNGVISGVINPADQPGIYDFVVQATDAGSRVAHTDFSIQVFP